MSLDTTSISGPMTAKRSLNNILASLNIAQGKGTFSLRESAIIFTSLQKLNEFVNKHENDETTTTLNSTPQVSQVQSSTVKPQEVTIVDKPSPPLPEINLNTEETIEI